MMNSLYDVVGGLEVELFSGMRRRVLSIESAERETVLLGDERLRVGMVGEFNCGKSTLVNALYKREVAATDVLEMTSWVATYRGGEADTATLVISDVTSLGDTSPVLTFDEFSTRCKERMWDFELLALVERVDVTLTGSPLAATVVDCPGLGAVTRANEARLARALALADAVLWTVDIEAIGDLREAVFLRRLSQAGTPIVPVLTKADLVEFDAGALAEACAYLAGVVGTSPECVRVTAARSHLLEPDESDGIDALRAFIDRTLVPIKGDLRAKAAAASKAQARAEVRSLLIDSREALRIHHASNEAVRDRVKRIARAASADAESAARSFTRREFLGGKAAEIAARLENEGEMSAEALGRIVDDILGEGHLARFWEALVAHVSESVRRSWTRWLQELDGGVEVDIEATAAPDVGAAHGPGRNFEIGAIDSELATSLKASLGTGAAATAWFAWLAPGAGFIPFGAALTGVGIPVAVIGAAVSVALHRYRTSVRQRALAAQLDDVLPVSFIESVVEPVLIPAVERANTRLAEEATRRLLAVASVPDARRRLDAAESILSELESR